MTTCIVQYALRQGLADKVRINGPGESAMRRSFVVETVPVREITNAFGKPNRPSTPMKAVMGGYFENMAADV